MNNHDKLIDLVLDLKHETKEGKNDEGAFLVSTGKPNTELVWLPKKLVERDKNIFTMPLWLAVDKGLV